MVIGGGHLDLSISEYFCRHVLNSLQRERKVYRGGEERMSGKEKKGREIRRRKKGGNERKKEKGRVRRRRNEGEELEERGREGRRRS